MHKREIRLALVEIVIRAPNIRIEASESAKAIVR